MLRRFAALGAMMVAVCLALFIVRTARSEEKGPALTVYNQSFAVVRDHVDFQLVNGTNRVTFAGVTTSLEPDSVIVRDPSARNEFVVIEQNYRADPVTQQRLLALYEGKEIDFLVVRDGREEKVRGRIVRSGYVPPAAVSYAQQYRRYYPYRYGQHGVGQPIIEVDGALRFQLPGLPLFPSLADDSVLKPTLEWKVESERAARFVAEVSYVTGGFTWKSDYNLVVPEKGDTGELIGWVTVDNMSGKTFRDAKLKLIAGDVSKLAQYGYGPSGGALDAHRERASKAAVTEKSFDEYHMYTLARPTTLRDSEKKQIEFVRGDKVRSERIYVYDGATSYWGHRWWHYGSSPQTSPSYGVQCNKKTWVLRQFMNTKANGLGVPLPRGRLRFYRRDTDGRMEFVGENRIDHTPKDERVRVYTGNAFDIVGERKRTEYKSGHHWFDESFEIEIRNHKEEAVEVRVVEHMCRWSNWRLDKKSHDFEKTDASTAEFRVNVPADGSTTVKYTVHYWWPY